ncbi:MAG: hypothetical protein ACP5OC_01435 [Thermoplasmata archaeon]
MTLDQKKFRWIIEQKRRRISSSEMARIQRISVRYVNAIWKNYLEEWFAPSIQYKIQFHVKLNE